MKAMTITPKSDNEQADVVVDDVCPDFDNDCLTMTQSEANWCFMGCQNHPCLPGVNLGTAKGRCPIIQKQN